MEDFEKHSKEEIKAPAKYLLSFEESPYLCGILVSLIPYFVTILIVFQYIGPLHVSSSTSNSHTKKRSMNSLWMLLCRRQASWKGVKLSWLYFWNECRTRVWVLYLESFFIPQYRREWDKYCLYWHFNADDLILQAHKGEDIEKDISMIFDPALVNLSEESLPPSSESDSEGEGASGKPSGIKTPVKHSVHTSLHDHSQCEIITICVNGNIFQTQKKTLARFPYTLLGSEVLREQFYDPVNRYYFLDRNRVVFDSILYYYQSGGVLRRPEFIPLHIFIEEIEFYQLDEKNLAKFRDQEYITEEKIPDVPAGLLSRKLWCLFEFAGSSIQARIVSFVSFLVVIVSLTTFCIDTLPKYSDAYTIVIVNGEALNMGQVQSSFIDFHDPIDFIESACVAWFCFEITVRFISCPSNKAFFTDVLNITDILSVIPWFVTCIGMLFDMVQNADKEPDLSVDNNNDSSSFLALLKAVRLIRVLRILKLSRHSSGLQILGKTLLASVSELMMLIFFIVIGVLLFSSMMYYVEYEEATTPFTSIPLGFWWGVCTMTTVGYGDNVPVGIFGKLVGSFAALAGLLTIALPVPVIVNNFKFFCNQNFNKSEISLIQTNHVTTCPYRPNGELFHIDHDHDKDKDKELANISEYELLKHEHRDDLRAYLEAKGNKMARRQSFTAIRRNSM